MIVAGLDVGNATTELILADMTHEGVTALSATRRMTIGVKGSPSSLRGALELLADAERALGRGADHIVIADIVPTLQRTTSWPEARPDQGSPATLIDAPRLATLAGSGVAVGVLVDISQLRAVVDHEHSFVVYAGLPWSYETVAGEVNAALGAGTKVVGVLLCGDEAVLVANRLQQAGVIVIDEVDVGRLESGTRVALEIGADGGPLRHVIDPVWLARNLGLDADQVSALVPICASLRDATCAVVQASPSKETSSEHGEIVRTDGVRVPLALGPDQVALAVDPGSIASIHAPEGSELASLLDHYGPDFRDVFAVRVRDASRVPFSILSSSSRLPVGETLAEWSARPVTLVGEEAVAAYYGGMSTPGVPATSTVIDIGGGTIDVAHHSQHVTVAGAGDLVTSAIAQRLALPHALAELVKLTPSLRIESPLMATTEDGGRIFLDEPAPGRAVGWLCVRPSSREFIPFSDRLTAGQWRDQRFDLKSDVLGASIRRALRNIDDQPQSIVLTGGGACDDESVAVVSAQLGSRAVGRADIVGRYGPRWAVAWGLIVQWAASAKAEDRVTLRP